MSYAINPSIRVAAPVKPVALKPAAASPKTVGVVTGVAGAAGGAYVGLVAGALMGVKLFSHRFLATSAIGIVLGAGLGYLSFSKLGEAVTKFFQK